MLYVSCMLGADSINATVRCCCWQSCAVCFTIISRYWEMQNPRIYPVLRLWSVVTRPSDIEWTHSRQTSVHL